MDIDSLKYSWDEKNKESLEKVIMDLGFSPQICSIDKGSYIVVKTERVTAELYKDAAWPSKAYKLSPKEAELVKFIEKEYPHNKISPAMLMAQRIITFLGCAVGGGIFSYYIAPMLDSNMSRDGALVFALVTGIGAGIGAASTIKGKKKPLYF